MQTRCTHMHCVPSIVLFCTISSRGFSVTSLSWWEDELKQGIDYNSSKDKSSENWQQIWEFPQMEWALWGHLRSWLGWRNPKDGPIFFHYQLRDCGVTLSWNSSIRCQKCGGVRLCHYTSMWRQGIHPQAVHRAPSCGAGEGLRWGCRRRGLRTVFDIREEAAMMSMDLPGMNYAVHPLANTGFIPWLRQGSWAAWAVNTKGMHSLRNTDTWTQCGFCHGFQWEQDFTLSLCILCSLY